MLNKSLSIFGAILIAAGAASTLEAAPIYTVEFTNGVTAATQTDTGSTPPVTGSYSASFNITSVTSSGTANVGTLSSTQTHTLNQSTFSANADAKTTAQLDLIDLTFFDISNPSATGTILTSVNVFYSGDFFGTNTQHFLTDYLLDLDLAGTAFNFSLDGTGPFSGMYTTPTLVSVPLNTPLTFSLQGGVRTRMADPFPNDSGIVTINQTTQLLGLGNIFNLPTGFSVSSVDGNIFNNTVIVPLPPAIWLFVSGLTALVALRRRKQ